MVLHLSGSSVALGCKNVMDVYRPYMSILYTTLIDSNRTVTP